jgi:hypothetical protein
MQSQAYATSWVYLISKFTPEALLFEAFAIFCLIAVYAAFWIVKRKRLGASDSLIPAGVVKVYLNELIIDAERLRAQLFGLLAGAGVSMNGATLQMHGSPDASAQAINLDPAFLQKMALLEAKMADQNKAMQMITNDKAMLEKELAAAKAAGKNAPAAAADNGQLNDLQKKIELLEAKLAEYSVIEDDLANLKRLQQENTLLKSQLSAKTGAAPAAEAPKAEPAVAAAAPVEEVTEELAAEPMVEEELPADISALAEAPAPEPAAESAAAPASTEEPVATAASETTADPSFEGLVDQVEQSLQMPPAAAETPAPKTDEVAAIANPAPAKKTEPLTSAGEDPSLAAAPAPSTEGEKSDADLVAEFERMLNG